jgi:hypothetical protein
LLPQEKTPGRQKKPPRFLFLFPLEFLQNLEKAVRRKVLVAILLRKIARRGFALQIPQARGARKG